MAEGAAPRRPCKFSTRPRVMFVEVYFEFPPPTAPATPTLKTLSNELKSVNDWHSLGVKLNLNDDHLSEIGRNHGDNVKRCKNEVLGRWLKNTPTPTWEAVVEALYLMEAKAVADTIRSKYIPHTITTEGKVYCILVDAFHAAHQ